MLPALKASPQTNLQPRFPRASILGGHRRAVSRTVASPFLLDTLAGVLEQSTLAAAGIVIHPGVGSGNSRVWCTLELIKEGGVRGSA